VARERVVALEGVGGAPGVGVDVDAVAVLGEAVDEGADTSGAGEDGSPLLESQVGRDDDAALLVPAADDVVEETSGSPFPRSF